MTNPKDGRGRSLHLEKWLRRKVWTSHVEGLLSPASWGGFNHIYLPIYSLLTPWSLSSFTSQKSRKKDDNPPPSRTPSLPPPSSSARRHPGPRTSPQRISISGSTRSCLLRSGRGRDGPPGLVQTRTSRDRPVEDEMKAWTIYSRKQSITIR